MAEDEGRITVGVDDSGSADAALTWAIRHAARHGGELTFLHALADAGAGRAGDPALDRATAAMLLEAAADRALAAGVAAVDWSIVDEAPGPMLVAASEDSSLVVVGSRGQGARIGRSLGSVGQHVSRFAACPVAVVSSGPAARTGRVVVQVGGSAADRAALTYAFRHAAAERLEVEALHAWAEPPATGLEFSPLTEEDAGRRHLASEILLAEELAGFAATYPDVRVVRSSVPAAPESALLWASAHADLAVLPAPVPADPLQYPGGRAEQAVLRHAHCPVVYAR